MQKWCLGKDKLSGKTPKVSSKLTNFQRRGHSAKETNVSRSPAPRIPPFLKVCQRDRNLLNLETIAGVSGNSCSRSFPRMKASFRNYGIGFFHSLPIPEFWECFFFIPFPFPNYGNGFFSFPSRSRIVGMDFFHSLPVPKFWEWIFFIPFLFPNFGNGFFHSLPVPELWEWIFSIPFPFPN